MARSIMMSSLSFSTPDAELRLRFLSFRLLSSVENDVKKEKNTTWIVSRRCD